jgi:hypothetical protein
MCRDGVPGKEIHSTVRRPVRIRFLMIRAASPGSGFHGSGTSPVSNGTL